MCNTVTRGRLWAAALILTSLISTSVMADSWIQTAPNGGLEVLNLSDAAPAVVTVLGFDQNGLQVSIETPGFALVPYKNDHGEFAVVTWPDAAPYGEIGAPLLPVVRKLFLAPPGTEVKLVASVGEQITIDETAAGMSLLVQPRQTPVEKLPGALENASFDFDAAAYDIKADYLVEAATVRELGVARGQHLWMLEVYPIGYNPASRTLTYRPNINIDLAFTNGGEPSELNPLPAVQNNVLNPDPDAMMTRGAGNYLIVVADDFEAQIAPFAAHKEAKGFDVSTYVASSSSSSAIKSYIQSLWGGPNAPDYILLVGDTQHIGYFVGGGVGSPDTDLPFTCMDGASDWYPDICIGRFPADSSSELAAILDKVMSYDNAQFADSDYLKRAVFMASQDNYTVSEGTHNWVINNYMIPNEIDCLKLYCHTYNATTQQVRDAFNEGRFWGVYSGHGGTTSWADGPAFSQSDVNNLTNEDMYSMVMSFACVTGSFTLDECFTETWILAPNKGAVGIWGSSVNSYWTEDDVLEKRWFDSIFDEDDDVPMEFGPTFVDTLYRYLAEMGSGSTTRRYFEMYNLMGDPSLRYPGSCSDAGTVALDSGAYSCEDSEAAIIVSDCGLNTDDNTAETVTLTIVSDSEPAGEAVLLTETSPSSAEFVGAIMLSTAGGAGVLQISAGDVVSVTYYDADDGSGAPAVVTAQAVVDCTPPTILSVSAGDLEPRSAVVTIEADEPIAGVVYYGMSCGALNYTAGGGLGDPATVSLTGLLDNTTYFYAVLATDEAGNETYDDNDGICYNFSTPDIPNFYTELFESGNDLDDTTLFFTPNGTVDYYAGCAEEISELPTNPAGHASIYLSDDDYEQINLTGGAVVSLYGVDYDHFYVSSNGYITFTSGETDYTETLEEHFDQPRLSGLYDDLNPSSGGTVSWSQEDDRVVVTYLNVEEYSSGVSNTFQFEMYFNGDIRISYLGVGISDGLAGLSEGAGLDPDYYPADLSGLGACGPRPPTAIAGAASLVAQTETLIALNAVDDGLPEPASLDFVIDTLPAHGDLYDGEELIDAVPHVLAEGANEVLYRSIDWHFGQDAFQFFADDGGTPPEGGASNVAVVTIEITVPDSELLIDFPLDSDPGWACEGDWEFGAPVAGGTHNRDPRYTHSGDFIYGYNIGGDYASNMPTYCLTTAAIDCESLILCELRFWRWIGVERAPFDSATVEVSNDGDNWVELWANPDVTTADLAWTEITFDISGVADGQPTVYIRWTMGPTDDGTTYPGWSIDDVSIWGVDTGTACPGDLDGDNDVDLSDLAQLLSHYGETGAAYEDGDLDGDGDVDLADLAELLAVYGTTC